MKDTKKKTTGNQETLETKLAELTDRETELVTGGNGIPEADFQGLAPVEDPFADREIGKDGNKGTFYFQSDVHYDQIVLEDLYNTLNNQE